MKVVLIDDHQLFVQALKTLLLKEKMITDVKTFNSGKDFLSKAEKIDKPDIIVTDLMMEGMNGIELQKAAMNFYNNDMKVIILSSVTDVQTIKQTIRNGAKGFLSKDTSVPELLEALEKVHSGKQYIGENLRDMMLDSVFIEEQIVYHLNPKEKEVLNKICQGLTVKEIAFDMSLSPHTIQYYHKNILSKLKLKRTADLIVFAVQNGLYLPEIERRKR